MEQRDKTGAVVWQAKGKQVFSNVPASTEMLTNLNAVSVNHCCL
jgi:hypothetical protein